MAAKQSENGEHDEREQRRTRCKGEMRRVGDALERIADALEKLVSRTTDN